MAPGLPAYEQDPAHSPALAIVPRESFTTLPTPSFLEVLDPDFACLDPGYIEYALAGLVKNRLHPAISAFEFTQEPRRAQSPSIGPRPRFPRLLGGAAGFLEAYVETVLLEVANAAEFASASGALRIRNNVFMRSRTGDSMVYAIVGIRDEAKALAAMYYGFEAATRLPLEAVLVVPTPDRLMDLQWRLNTYKWEPWAIPEKEDYVLNEACRLRLI